MPDIQVVMLVARRSAADEPLPLGLSGWHATGRVAHLRPGPMGLGVLDQLLRSRLELALSRPWLIRLGESSGGNPFYALELGRALQRRGLPDVPDGSLPLPGNLQSVLSDRLTELPGDVMELLRRVEMLYDRRVATVRRVAEAEELEHALDRAVEAGVLDEVAGERLTFSHALLASAVQSLTGPIHRAALRRRLAELEFSGEARALHLALSAVGPDAALADEIAGAAADAAARGASDSAGRLAEHAAALTPETEAEVKASRKCLPPSTTSRRATELIQTLRECVLLPRRVIVRSIIERGQARGEIRGDIDPDAALELMAGPFLARVFAGLDTGPRWRTAAFATWWEILSERQAR